jgi:3-oxoacyl-[acyl-carrier protein] reductase
MSTGNVNASRIAVISGGAGGIGRAVVLRLNRAGFFPFILDSNEAAGKTVLEQVKKTGSGGEFIGLDLTSKAAVNDAFGQINSSCGRVDLMVNLAGGTLHAHSIQNFPLTEWLRVIDVNLKATFLCCQATLPLMKAQRRGVIINTSSNFAVTGSATRTAYSAAKASIIAFTKSLAIEARSYGIRVNAIAPGLTATDRVMKHYSQETWARQAESIPMRRVAEPSDIAEGVAFLAGDDSKFMTGQTLHVNGGLVLP